MAKNPDRHYESPDPNPVRMPSGMKRPETLQEQIRRLVRSERFAQQAAAEGFETFEEADDFDVEDDPPDPSTPFEPFFDPALGREVTPHDILRNRDLYEAETKARVESARRAATPPAAPPAAGPEEPEKPAS